MTTFEYQQLVLNPQGEKIDLAILTAKADGNHQLVQALQCLQGTTVSMVAQPTKRKAGGPS